MESQLTVAKVELIIPLYDQPSNEDGQPRERDRWDARTLADRKNRTVDSPLGTANRDHNS